MITPLRCREYNILNCPSIRKSSPPLLSMSQRPAFFYMFSPVHPLVPTSQGFYMICLNSPLIFPPVLSAFTHPFSLLHSFLSVQRRWALCLTKDHHFKMVPFSVSSHSSCSNCKFILPPPSQEAFQHVFNQIRTLLFIVRALPSRGSIYS